MQHQPGLHRPELVQRLTYRKSTNEIGPSLHYTSERAHISFIYVYLIFVYSSWKSLGVPNNFMNLPKYIVEMAVVTLV